MCLTPALRKVAIVSSHFCPASTISASCSTPSRPLDWRSQAQVESRRPVMALAWRCQRDERKPPIRVGAFVASLFRSDVVAIQALKSTELPAKYDRMPRPQRNLFTILIDCEITNP